MKIHKTRTDKRETYTYRYADGGSVEIRVGENGVTELDIKRLHAFDDSEVYYNNKNMRPKITKDEKVKIEEFKREYIKKFKSRHGYEPNKSDVRDAVKDAFPSNYNLSIDYTFENNIDEDKSRIMAALATDDHEESLYSERMEEVMELMSDKQKEVIIMLLKGYKQTEIAQKLGISSAGVKKRIDGAKNIIKKYYKK